MRIRDLFTRVLSVLGCKLAGVCARRSLVSGSCGEYVSIHIVQGSEGLSYGFDNGMEAYGEA